MFRSLPAGLLRSLAAAVLLARGATSKFKQDYEECPQQRSLHCRNGSTCAPGVAVFGERHDHLNLPTQDRGYYCRCPPGFIGHDCSHEATDCDMWSNGDYLRQACYHGSRCRAQGGEFYCDCKGLNDSRGSTDPKFAGENCQHESTSFCAVSLAGEHAPNHQFCTNHGDCVRMVTGDEEHPGCICRDGWVGEHCEIQEIGDDYVDDAVDGEREGGAGAIAIELFALLLIPIAVMAVIFIALDRRHKQQRNQPEEERKVLAEGDLEPDGSGTIGSQTQYSDADGPVEGTEKKVLAEGDLDPDGSGTLGSRPQEIDADGESDLSMTDEFVGETEIV